MKNISIKSITVTAVISLSLLGTGCGKIADFGDTNVNPAGISSPVTSALLTNVESAFGGFAVNNRKTTYCQYVSESQYTDVSLYALPQLEMGGTYAGVLNDLQVIINYNSDGKTSAVASAYGSNNNQIAIAKILRSYIYWVLTDSWGDIPYSEALLGAANSSPKFDKQEDVYFSVMKDLKNAVAGFDNGTTVKGDIIYGGDVAKWKKLGNTIRMLMAMRLTNKYPNAGDKAAVQFAEAYSNAAGYISANADNFSVAFPGGTFKNTWYLVYEARDDYSESKTMTDVMAGLGDARQSVFGTNNVGFPYGLTRDLAVQFGNSVGNGHSRVLAASKRTEASTVVVINAATALLAKAEAIERGWVSGTTADAQIAYEASIAASHAEWGVSMSAGYLTGSASYTSGGGVASNIGAGTGAFDNFRAASNNIQDATTTTKLQRIALQRWVAAYPNGQEGWAEQRRTGIPNLKTTRFATGKFVTRYVYGVNDYSFNNVQTKAAAALLAGGDVQDAKVWWDQ